MNHTTVTQIDPTTYVEVEEGKLSFGDEKVQAKFELGVCMAVYKWDELNTAVENSWGGPQSADKRDWLAGVVVDLFEAKVVDIQMIEETLLYAMVDEFDTEVDNDSALEVAALIVKIYLDVQAHNYTTVDELYAKWQAKQGTSTATKVHVGADPNNPDASDSEDEDDEEDESAPQLQEDEDAMQVDQGPVVDDDGFELVQKKGRRRH